MISPTSMSQERNQGGEILQHEIQRAMRDKGMEKTRGNRGEGNGNGRVKLKLKPVVKESEEPQPR